MEHLKRPSLGLALALHAIIRLLERLARDKHSSLLRKFVNYGQKKFYNIGPRPVTYFRKLFKDGERKRGRDWF